MPTSAVISAVSSSSSVSSSSVRRDSAPASFSRERASPSFSRSVHDFLSPASAGSVADLRLKRSNMGGVGALKSRGGTGTAKL